LSGARRGQRVASEGPSLKRRILFVTPEISDFVKVGGLGDVSSALPRALASSFDVRILLPGYPSVVESGRPITIVGRLPGAGDIPSCDLGRLETEDGLVVYVLIDPDFYERAGTPYGDPTGCDFADNDVRFGRLGLAAADIAAGLGDPDWSAELLHVNDWPAAMAPAYLAWRRQRIPSLLTIHNLSYQGVFERESLRRIGGPDSAFDIEGVEFYGRMSFLKAGLYYASHVTTVSATYAREIATPEFGCGLDGLIKRRAARGEVTGILNGIDEGWSVSLPDNEAVPFAVGDWKTKRANAALVRRRFGLDVSRGPLFAVVSRLVQQKGVELIVDAANDIVGAGGQIVVTGKGDAQIEEAVRSIAVRHPGKIAVEIGFDEARAREIYAGSDFLLMPSRFEPCGLSQLYAQKCGALPIVHRTGGLADTVAEGLTGFLFHDFSAPAFRGALRRAFETFSVKTKLNAMRRIAMTREFGWKSSASDYEALYLRAIGNRPPSWAVL
jgi:starch synthase